MDASPNNIFILGLVVSLLQTKPLYLEVKEYIKLLKWKIKLSFINENNNNNNNDDKNKDEMLKLLISKLDTVIKDWVELKSTYTLNSNRKRTINIDPNKDFFINTINNNNESEENIPPPTTASSIKTNKTSLYHFSLYFSKMISHILDKNDDVKERTNENINNQSNTINREKEEFINNSLLKKNQNQNHQKASKFRKLNNNFKKNDRADIEMSSLSSQTILPIYAIEIFFKQFFDQFFQEFRYMEREILNDKLDIDDENDLLSEKNDNDNVNDADNDDLSFLFHNMTLKESYEINCPHYHNSSSFNFLPPDIICTNYDQYRQYSNNIKEVDNDESINILETLNIIEILFYSIQELISCKKEYFSYINNNYKKLIRVFIEYLIKGIQFQYYHQLYHHDFHFPLYDSLQKIQSLIILISKSSCTMYIYTLTLLLKECRKHLHCYFQYIESVNTIEEEDDIFENNSENDTILDEFNEEILNKDENFSYNEEILKEEYNTIDNLGFSFIKDYEALSTLFSILDQMLQTNYLNHYKNLAKNENVQTLQYFFSRELDHFIESYLFISTHSQSFDYSSSSISSSSTSTLFSSYPFPYENLIKLKMSQLLNQLKILSKDWNEIKFLRYEMIQDFNNLPSNVKI